MSRTAKPPEQRDRLLMGDLVEVESCDDGFEGWHRPLAELCAAHDICADIGTDALGCGDTLSAGPPSNSKLALYRPKPPASLHNTDAVLH